MLKYRQVNGNPESSLGSENGSLTTLSIFSLQTNKQKNWERSVQLKLT